MGLTIPVYGAVVEWSDDGVAFDRIAKAKNVVVPEVSKDFRDVTTLDSVDSFRDWAKGLKDGGELTLETFYSKEGYVAAVAKEALSGGAYFRVTLALDDDQLTGDAFTWRAHVTPVIPGETVEGDLMLNLNLRTTGAVAWVQGNPVV